MGDRVCREGRTPLHWSTCRARGRTTCARPAMVLGWARANAFAPGSGAGTGERVCTEAEAGMDNVCASSGSRRPLGFGRVCTGLGSWHMRTRLQRARVGTGDRVCREGRTRLHWSTCRARGRTTCARPTIGLGMGTGERVYTWTGPPSRRLKGGASIATASSGSRCSPGRGARRSRCPPPGAPRGHLFHSIALRFHLRRSGRP
jgi:hypothetical protein